MSEPALKIVESVDSHEKAVQLANEIERLEAVLKSMKAQLKAYVDENGPVETQDKVWGYITITEWDFEPEKLKELAQIMVLEGENPWQYLSLQAKNIKKLGWKEDFLSQYGSKKVSYKFQPKKKKK